MARKSLISCGLYDPAKALEIEALGFKVHYENCGLCGRKVMLSPTSRQLLDSDDGCSPACSRCAEPLLEKTRLPINITLGQIEEYFALIAKSAAKNN